MSKEPEKKGASEEESNKEPTESSFSEYAKEDSLEIDFAAVSEYFSIREGLIAGK